jgi:hypothetical protein
LESKLNLLSDGTNSTAFRDFQKNAAAAAAVFVWANIG